MAFLGDRLKKKKKISLMIKPSPQPEARQKQKRDYERQAQSEAIWRCQKRTQPYRLRYGLATVRCGRELADFRLPGSCTELPDKYPCATRGFLNNQCFAAYTRASLKGSLVPHFADPLLFPHSAESQIFSKSPEPVLNRKRAKMAVWVHPVDFLQFFADRSALLTFLSRASSCDRFAIASRLHRACK